MYNSGLGQMVILGNTYSSYILYQTSTNLQITLSPTTLLSTITLSNVYFQHTSFLAQGSFSFDFNLAVRDEFYATSTIVFGLGYLGVTYNVNLKAYN